MPSDPVQSEFMEEGGLQLPSGQRRLLVWVSAAAFYGEMTEARQNLVKAQRSTGRHAVDRSYQSHFFLWILY